MATSQASPRFWRTLIEWTSRPRPKLCVAMLSSTVWRGCAQRRFMTISCTHNERSILLVSSLTHSSCSHLHSILPCSCTCTPHCATSTRFHSLVERLWCAPVQSLCNQWVGRWCTTNIASRLTVACRRPPRCVGCRKTLHQDCPSMVTGTFFDHQYPCESVITSSQTIVSAQGKYLHSSHSAVRCGSALRKSLHFPPKSNMV